MSKYDKYAKENGLNRSTSNVAVKEKPRVSKYSNYQEEESNPKKIEVKKEEPKYEGKSQPLQPMGQGYKEKEPTLLQKVLGFDTKEFPKYTADRKKSQTAARDIPLIGSALKGADFAAKKSDPVADIMRSFYTPGAGVANVAGAYGAVGNAINKVAPKLGGTLVGRVAQEAIKEFVVGAPITAGQSLSSGNPSLKDAAKAGLIGGAMGAVTGGTAPLVGAGLKKAFTKPQALPSYDGAGLGMNTGNKLSAPIKVKGKLSQDVIAGVPKTQISGVPKVSKYAAEREMIQQPVVNEPTPISKYAKEREAIQNTQEVKSNWEYGVSNGQKFGKTPEEVERLVGNYKKGYMDNHVTNSKISYQTVPKPKVKDFIDGYDLYEQHGTYHLLKSGAKAGENLEVFGKIQATIDDGVKHFVLSPELQGKGIGQKMLKYLDEQGIDITKANLMSNDYAKAVNKFKNTTKVTKTPVTAERERGFVTTLKDSPKPPQGLKDKLTAAYKPITNQDTVDLANNRITDIEKAASYVMGKEKFTAEKVATAHRLIDEFSKSGNHQRAVDIAEKIAEEGTRAGQSIQAFSIYNRLTPEGVLVHAQRIAKKTNEGLNILQKNVIVTEGMAAQLTDLAHTTRAMTGVKEMSNNVMDILDRAKSGSKLSAEDTEALQKFVNESKQFVKEIEKKPVIKRPTEIKDKRVKDSVIKFLDKQEEAAKARLRAKGHRVSSTPIDIYADYAIIGAAKMARGTVKFADWSADMIKDLGEEIKPLLENIYNKAAETMNQSAKKVTKSSVSNAERIVNNLIKKGDLKGEEAELIRTLAEKVSNLSGDAKNIASQDLQFILKQLESPSALKKIASTQTIAQLLNPKTQVRNALGNELFYRLERLNKYVTAPLDWGRVQLFGGQRSVTFRTNNQGEYWSNWLMGLKAGWRGVNVEGLQTQFDIGPAAFNGKWNPLTYMEKALGASLKSFDTAAYKRAVNDTIGEMATLRALNEGLTGEAKKIAIQKYIRNVDEHVLKISDDYGKYMTFQDNNLLSKGLVGLKRGLNFGKDFGVGDLVLKYPKTPGALLMRALEYSPAGFLRSASIAAKPFFKKEPNTAEAMQALSRAIVGTAGLSGLGFYLADVGILTGAASKDRDVRDLQRSAGQGQYQVNLSALKRWALSGFDPKEAKLQEDDNLYTYDWMQPVAIAVSVGANAGKAIEEKQLNGKAALGLAGAAYSSLEGGINSLVETSVLSGVKRAFTSYPGQSVTDKIVDILASAPASFVPTAVNQTKQLTDNANRETYDPDKLHQAYNMLKARVPGIAGQLPQRYDTLGSKKVTYQNNSFFNVLLNPGFTNKYKLTPEAKMVVKLITDTGDITIAPRVPSKTITIHNGKGEPSTQKLTTEQFTELQRLTGEETVRLLKLIPADFTNDQKLRAIADMLTDAGKKARYDLKTMMGVQ